MEERRQREANNLTKSSIHELDENKQKMPEHGTISKTAKLLDYDNETKCHLKRKVKMTDVSTNYKNKNSETLCRICHPADKITSNLFNCYFKDQEKPIVATKSEEIINNISTAKIEDIMELAKILQQVLQALASTHGAVRTITDGDGTSQP